MNAVLDKSKPYAEVYGEPFGDHVAVAYEQNNMYFGRDGKQVVLPKPEPKKEDRSE